MPQSKITNLLNLTLDQLGLKEELDFKVDIPPRRELGDYASNIAILYAKKLSRNPIQIAEQIGQIAKNLDQENLIEKVEIVRPGFINFTLTDTYLQNSLLKVQTQDHDWGKSNAGKGKGVLLEFVSANPTGPLHVGHGRWAVIGDDIARLLKAVGFNVEKEFYVNNVGNQIERLIESVKAVREGRPVPEGGYGGNYIKEIAKEKVEGKDQILELVLNEQRKTLESLGVNFENWFFENELHDKDQVLAAVERLHDLGQTFEGGGAIWFKSEEHGDDKNRVLIRENGSPTYFAADIAYHLDKYARKYDRIINLWGTDHHGYVARLKAAVKAAGEDPKKLEIIIGQLVTLYRGKEAVRMSKRTGEMVTLQEVIDEIGVDATRFFFAATDVNSHLDFDLELAKNKSNDNPVYYVQYAHARICSILRKSEKQSAECELSTLTHPAERNLIFKLITWPDVVIQAARLRHPHKICEYGKELATLFHSFYEKCKVLGNPSRLVLVDASRIVLRNVLEFLGISAPEAM